MNKKDMAQYMTLYAEIELYDSYLRVHDAKSYELWKDKIQEFYALEPSLVTILKGLMLSIALQSVVLAVAYKLDSTSTVIN